MFTIIIEGPDGAGKTTIMNQLLSSIPGSATQHFGAPTSEKEALEYHKVYDATLSTQNERGTSVFIMDRAWYSDIVYGPVLRGRREISDKNVEALENKVKRLGGGIVLYVSSDIDTLYDRCTTRGEELIKTKEMLQRILDGYEELFSSSGNLSVIKIKT